MTTSGSILTRAPDGTPLRVADLTRAPIDDAAAARVSGRRRRLALWNAGARAVIICVAHSSWGFTPTTTSMNDVSSRQRAMRLHVPLLTLYKKYYVNACNSPSRRQAAALRMAGVLTKQRPTTLRPSLFSSPNPPGARVQGLEEF